jgi:hypothetical protein
MVDMLLGFGIVALGIGQLGLWLVVTRGKGRR